MVRLYTFADGRFSFWCLPVRVGAYVVFRVREDRTVRERAQEKGFPIGDGCFYSATDLDIETWLKEHPQYPVFSEQAA